LHNYFVFHVVSFFSIFRESQSDLPYFVELGRGLGLKINDSQSDLMTNIQYQQNS